jgi:hypothetical protein
MKKNIMKKNIPPFIGIMIILVISIPMILYLIGLTCSFEEIPKIEEEFPKKDIKYFFGNDYYPILEEESTYDCDLEMDVFTVEKRVSLNTTCKVTPPFSAIEAFLAVVRGNIETKGVIYYSGVDEDDDEKEAIKKRLGMIDYPFFAVSEGEEITEEGETSLCFLPCIDGLPPSSFDVLSVDYSPSRNYLSNLFDNYDEEEFKKLIVSSNYFIEFYYENMEERFEWRYLFGQFDVGKFNLEITFDKPIKEIKCEREDIEPKSLRLIAKLTR